MAKEVQVNSSAAVSVFFSSEVTARWSIILCRKVDSFAEVGNQSLRIRISFIRSGSGVGVPWWKWGFAL